MAVPVRAQEKQQTTGELGDRSAMHFHKPCRYGACPEPGITSLGDEALCCDHFVLRCYEFLEQVDAERAKNNADYFLSAALRGSVDRCLQGALDVSLRSDSLNNLQKARLMDILLWAGEFVHQMDSRKFGCSAGALVNVAQPRERAPYVAPQVKRRGLLPQ